jgi:hypothetical protein
VTAIEVKRTNRFGPINHAIKMNWIRGSSGNPKDKRFECEPEAETETKQKVRHFEGVEGVVRSGGRERERETEG